MTIAYSHWSAEAPQPQLPAPRRGMAAYRDAHRPAEPASHRWKAVAVTVAGHALLLYVLFFVAVVAPKQVEMQSITVSITQTQAKKPEPVPVPKLEKAPEIVLPNLPQIDTAAPPSPNAILAAPPVPPAPVKDAKDKATDDSPVTPPVFDAAYLNNPAPAYPNMSRRLREVGVVQLRVRVGATGEPLDVLLAKSSGYVRLDDSARAAVQKWKFQPAKRNGNAVEAWVIVPVEFSLTRG
jgi:periplasmic protein TonB